MPRKKKSEPENQIENLSKVFDKLPTAPEQQTEPLTQAENLDPIGSNMPFSNQDQQTEPLNQIENLYPMGYKLPDTEPQSNFGYHGIQITRDGANQDQQTEPQSNFADNCRQITRDGANQDQQTEPQSNPRDYLTASLTSVQATIAQLFEKQAELRGAEVADTVFDAFESGFISRLEQRLQPFVDVVLPQIQDIHTELKERTTARVERRLSAFDRLKQIAATVTDECKLLPPVVAVGEFVNWEPIEIKENE